LDHLLSLHFSAGRIWKACGSIVSHARRFLAGGEAVKAFERGIAQRATVLGFDGVEQAIAAHNSPAYQEALKALGNSCERDVRIVGERALSAEFRTA
jgi:uncharacterized protein (DUF1330 family)